MNARQSEEALAPPTFSDGGGQPDAVPYLPPSRPTATGAATFAVPASAVPAPDPVFAIDQSADAPYVPAPAPVAAPPAEAPVFDAKAMVDSQKRVNDNPAYGALPSGTEASREASKQLRAKAQRKRARNKLLGRVLVVLLLAGVAAGGWFGYQAYQDEQERNAADRAAAADDDDTDDPAALTPLGEQAEVVAGLDTLSDAPVGRAGGLAGAIDSAREVVGDGSEGDDEAAADPGAAPTPFTYDVVVPPIVRTNGERLPDATGRETYVINADEFAAGDPDGFGLFVRLMAIQPQLIPEANAFADLPPVAPDQIIISVVRTGDRIERAIVFGESVDLRVDVTP
jgi:hypothetical protein